MKKEIVLSLFSHWDDKREAELVNFICTEKDFITYPLDDKTKKHTLISSRQKMFN